MADIYFWRQWFVLFPGLLYALCVGFTLAFPAVLNPAIMSPNSTDIRTTGDHASWIGKKSTARPQPLNRYRFGKLFENGIFTMYFVFWCCGAGISRTRKNIKHAAINGVGGLLGCVGLSPIMVTFGRKAANYSINVVLFVGWIIIPFANNIAALYAARFIQGISVGNIYINDIIICEYTHPSRRGYFITFKKLIIAVGVLACHAMNAFWTWRQIAIFAAMPSFVAIILTFFWPESPSHLAIKQRFSECERSFKWLNGNSEESQSHLKSLIDAQMNKTELKKNNSYFLVELARKFLMKDFQKAFLISSLLTLSLDLSGRYYLVAYITQMMTELLGNTTSASYFTVAADLLAIIALFLSTVVITYFKRRTILFSSGIFAVVFMLLISFLVYMKTIYIVSKYFLWFTAFIVILQCFIINIGITPLAFTLCGEIFPLEHKGLGVCVSGIVFNIFYALTLKTTPVLMELTGLYGVYAIYGLLLALCLAVLYKIVPETKDRTLQEIENDMNDVQNKEVINMENKEVIKMERQRLNSL